MNRKEEIHEWTMKVHHVISMSRIKIFVTHTPNKNDKLVGNPLMVDVIAGADYQKLPIPLTMVPDNSGDNISSKNKSYCELTTQYWAWKNVDADYYGFCHYRRFLSLTDRKFQVKEDPSGRGQVYLKILNDATIEQYGLSDVEAMQNYIEKFDCILPQKQDLRLLPTPRGAQKSVYRHFAAHNRLFIHASDLKILVNIVKEKFPEYKEDMIEYLNNPFFWGFNCFVLKKELFHKLCEFEFGVLFEMEKQVDLSLYNRQASRIYGFMGEILSCIYFYHMIKTNKKLKVAETKVIYFEHTDNTVDLKPVKDTVVPLVFNIDTVPPCLFFVTIESFLKHCKKDEIYDIIILHHGVQKSFREAYKEKFAQHKNITVRCFDYDEIDKTLYDLGKVVEDVRLLIPWVLSEYKKAVFINWNTLFHKEIGSILDYNVGEYLAAGVSDVLMIGRAFDVDGKYEKYLKKKVGIRRPEKLLNTDMMVMNLEKMRDNILIKNILLDEPSRTMATYKERFNALCQGNIKILPQEWNYYYTEDLEEKRLIGQIPLYLSDEYNDVTETAAMTNYNSYMMWNIEGSKRNIAYWEIVRQTGYQHLFYEHFSYIQRKIPGRSSWVFSKVNGWFLCVQDHGLPYTLGYTMRKAKHALMKN